MPTTTALVVEAEAPIDTRVLLGTPDRTLRVLVDAGGGPSVLERRDLRLKKDQWLVRGMEVPVTLGADGEPFEVDWDANPTMEERVAAADPALIDPVGARNTVNAALAKAGVPGVSATPNGTPKFDEALAKLASEPAPSGKTRALVRIVTSLLDHDGENDETHLDGTHPAVLQVNVPGQAPYVVFVKKLKIPANRWDVRGTGIPALVSAKDPQDVDLRWADLEPLEDQVGQRVSDSMQTAMKDASDMEAAWQQRTQDAMNAKWPEGVPVPAAGSTVPGAAGIPGMSPEVLKQNGEMALRYLTDPAQRKMIIDQYKLMGIDLDDAE